MVQVYCFSLDKDKLETELRIFWKDFIISRIFDMGYSLYYFINSELAFIRRICDYLFIIMSIKAEELVRSLRVGINSVVRENSDFKRQKLEVERGLRVSQEVKGKVEKEVQVREVKFQVECIRQIQLVLEEKAALRKERDNLVKLLEEKKREAEQLKMQLVVSSLVLDICIKVKVGWGVADVGCTGSRFGG